MKFFKEHYKIFMIMVVFWFLLTMDFSIQNILVGMVVSALVSVSSKRILFEEDQSLFKGVKGRKLFFYFIKLFGAIFKSAFEYVRNVLVRDYEIVVFEMILQTNDPIIVGIISNSITLTPGTITIEAQGNKITVMQLAKKGITQEELEQPIRESFERYLK
ncbi:MAG: Na+/H+ antiporter subunit E [Candidatus Izemoplasmatales bacterium]|nr:Na+/H+ antiporter subunit E [Candidatus Izemoplasmatales bacterium]